MEGLQAGELFLEELLNRLVEGQVVGRGDLREEGTVGLKHGPWNLEALDGNATYQSERVADEVRLVAEDVVDGLQVPAENVDHLLLRVLAGSLSVKDRPILNWRSREDDLFVVGLGISTQRVGALPSRP